MLTPEIYVIEGTLSAVDEPLIGSISSQIGPISGSISSQIGPPVDPYEGDYVVIPKFVEQVLPTKNKTMQDDMVVKEIPTAEVSNPAGGLTLTIG